VVAAPTAGACGVLPGVLLTLGERLGAERERLLDALLAAAGVGVVIAARAPVSGAFGGCQSEVGIASAMAAAAAVVLAGGDAEASAQAAAFALINLMGLVCDPVAGPVEIPCILRNAVGAANALSAADLALAGIRSVIPPDEVVDALRDVQERLPAELRCTLSGGLSSTPTGRRLQAEWLGRLK
jgi:L-serine dehydratase